MLSRWFLGFNAVAFLGFGILCLFRPEVVSSVTEFVLPTGAASVEARAMYGGLQTGLGALALLGLRNEHLKIHALVGLLFVYLGLATGRAYGIAVTDSPGAFQIAAVIFESMSAAITIYLLRSPEA